jgi:hypothetical protein
LALRADTTAVVETAEAKKNIPARASFLNIEGLLVRWGCGGVAELRRVRQWREPARFLHRSLEQQANQR